MELDSPRLLAAATALVKQGLESIVLLDAFGTVLEAGPGIVERVGLRADELVGRPMIDVVHADDRKRLAAELSALADAEPGRAIRIEYRVSHPNGRIRWLRTLYVNHLADPAIGAIVATCQDVTDYRQTSAAYLATHHQAQLLEDQLRSLTGRLLTVQEDERQRIAREVHDELGQVLTALKLDLAWAKRRLASRRTTPAKKLLSKCAGMSTLIDDAIGSVRRIASGLHPGDLDQLGLVAAVEASAREFGARTGIVTTVTATLDDANLDRGTCAQLLRITQEAMTNIGRHARATAAWITLDSDQDGVRLVVSDNGCGMVSPPARSLGLLGMQERARLCGGRLVVDSASDRGTSIRALVPMRPGATPDSIPDV